MPMGTRDSGGKRAKIWGRLSDVCGRIHKWLYGKSDRNRALKTLPKLEDLLSALPEDEMAIVRWEGYALYHELRGELALALAYRLREIELMDMLYKHIETQGCKEGTTAWRRQRRDRDALEERRAIVESLRLRLK